MKIILFAAELGNGLGHIAPLKIIADRLLQSITAKSKVRVVFAIAFSGSSRVLFDGAPYPVLQAPTLPSPIALKSHSSSYAEILAEIGYSRSRELKYLLSSWDDLFEVVKPDLLVLDHSPTASLAARGRIPVISIGNGFTLPPDDMPLFPALQAGFAPPVIQKTILDNINAHLTNREQPTIKRLPELLKTQKRAIFTLPELDPYGPLRHEPMLGTYHDGLAPTAIPKEPHLFLYVGSDPAKLDMIVQSANRTGVQISAYLGGAKSASSEFLRSRGCRVFDTPPPLKEVLEACTIVVSHAGSGLANAALMVGRPQITIPVHAESKITAGRIEKLGVGVSTQRDDPVELDEKIATMLQSKRFEADAMELAHNVADRQLPKDSVGEIVSQIKQLVRDKAHGDKSFSFI